ncbi:MAG: Lin0512 family protein [Minwuia sp.]|uniref:Lin0512 family protein n=1 Tax=Minwuia sp. TaxID=2493630 RepID=UPI003A87D564
MSGPRAILEMGAGTDLHGRDYTKAAIRAVQNALQHSSLTFVRTLGIDPSEMTVDVTIGVQKPDQVDCGRVAEALPVGKVSVTATLGGLDVNDAENNDLAVIASAMIAVRLPA